MLMVDGVLTVAAAAASLASPDRRARRPRTKASAAG